MSETRSSSRLIQNHQLVTDGLSQVDLSTSRGQDRMDAQFCLMQRGLVYPAPYARFATFWRAKGRRITRWRVRDTVKRVRRFIHNECGSSNSSAIVGVSFPLFRQWCREHDLSVPTGMEYKFPLRWSRCARHRCCRC